MFILLLKILGCVVAFIVLVIILMEAYWRLFLKPKHASSKIKPHEYDEE